MDFVRVVVPIFLVMVRSLCFCRGNNALSLFGPGPERNHYETKVYTVNSPWLFQSPVKGPSREFVRR